MTGDWLADRVTGCALHHLEIRPLTGDAHSKIPAVDVEYKKEQPPPATGELAGSMGRQVKDNKPVVTGRMWQE